MKAKVIIKRSGGILLSIFIMVLLIYVPINVKAYYINMDPSIHIASNIPENLQVNTLVKGELATKDTIAQYIFKAPYDGIYYVQCIPDSYNISGLKYEISNYSSINSLLSLNPISVGNMVAYKFQKDETYKIKVFYESTTAPQKPTLPTIPIPPVGPHPIPIDPTHPGTESYHPISKCLWKSPTSQIAMITYINENIDSIKYTIEIKSDDYGNDFNSDYAIQEGTNIQGIINYSGDVDFFKFVPSVTGTYKICSTDSTDIHGYLYNSEKQLLSENSGSSGENFCINYSLIAGQTYYLKVNYDSNTAIGKYVIKIQRVSGNSELEYEYDSSMNRIIYVKINGQRVVHFIYDSNGNLINKEIVNSK